MEGELASICTCLVWETCHCPYGVSMKQGKGGIEALCGKISDVVQ